MSDTHLMIVHPQSAAPILTGHKLVEARFGTNHALPFGQIKPGDVVYIKPSGQRVAAKAIVHRVDEYEGLAPEDIDHLQRIYNDLVLGDQSFWNAKRESTHATFITLERVNLLPDESTVPEGLLAPGHDAWRLLRTTQQQSRAA